MARRAGRTHEVTSGGFVRSIALLHERVASFDNYPFSVPAVRALESLDLHPKVTFFVGENGSGKSTLIEALAVAAGFNAEGGSRNFSFATRQTQSELHDVLRLVRGPVRPRDGFFLRAESLYNVASNIDDLDNDPDIAGGGARLVDAFGGRSLPAQSHGKSFLALMVWQADPSSAWLRRRTRVTSVLLHARPLLDERDRWRLCAGLQRWFGACFSVRTKSRRLFWRW